MFLGEEMKITSDYLKLNYDICICDLYLMYFCPSPINLSYKTRVNFSPLKKLGTTNSHPRTNISELLLR